MDKIKILHLPHIDNIKFYPIIFSKRVQQMLTVFTVSDILQTNGLQCLLAVLLYPQPQPLLLQRDVQSSELL